MVTVRISDRGVIRTVERIRSPQVGKHVKYEGRSCLVLAVTWLRGRL